MAVHGGDILDRRGATAANRPHRFIGDHRILGAGAGWDRIGQLPGDRRKSVAVVTLGFSFTNTDHRHHAGVLRGGRLVPHQGVAFAMIGAPFGVADNHRLAAQFGQHRRANVAGMGAGGGRVTVLRAQGDRAGSQGRTHRRQPWERRADQQIGAAHGPFGDRRR